LKRLPFVVYTKMDDKEEEGEYKEHEEGRRKRRGRQK
jgi:hypothetical protein